MLIKLLVVEIHILDVLLSELGVSFEHFVLVVRAALAVGVVVD